MQYKGFFLEVVLSAAVAAHCFYQYRAWRRDEKRKPWVRSAAVLITALAVLYGLAVLIGLVNIIAGGDPVTSNGLGAASILLAIWLSFQLSKACGK